MPLSMCYDAMKVSRDYEIRFLHRLTRFLHVSHAADYCVEHAASHTLQEKQCLQLASFSLNKSSTVT